MKLISTAAAVLSLLAWTSASSIIQHRHHEKRADISLGQIYAFGANMSGTPVFFRDSIAYIGNLSLTGANGTYASFVEDNSTHLIASPSDSTSWNASYLAINTTSGAEDAVILVEDADSSSLSTTGFFHYGFLLAWVTSAGVLELNWYAQRTDAEGVWALKWAADGSTTDRNNSYPVVLRTLPTNSS